VKCGNEPWFHKMLGNYRVAIQLVALSSVQLHRVSLVSQDASILIRQPYGRQDLHVQRALWYGDYSSHCILKTESGATTYQ
jgi:hypothetical protein